MALFDFSVLRELRREKNLTIAEVAAASGVSAAVISKLERNLTCAELDTLYRLSRVFGVTCAELLNLSEAGVTHKLNQTEHRSGDFIFQEIRYKNLRCLHGRANKGSRVSRPEIHRDDYEICWVLRGRLRLTLPGENYQLTVGNSVQFDALLEHSYEALEDCELIILHIRKEKRF